MSLIAMFCHPITISFLVIAIGLCLGKVKVGGIGLDLASVLIVAVVAGCLLSRINGISNIDQMNSYMKMLSSLGTSLFVSAIGISAGYSLNTKAGGKLYSAALGMLMVLSAFIIMKIISIFEIDITYSNLLGVLCGSLTTTPGLSAVCEKNDIASEEASLGYGSSYLFGVICTVLAVQILTKKETVSKKAEKDIESNATSHALFGGLFQISTTIVLGRLLGCIKTPYIHFSLGNSGGILCTGIVIGYFVAKHLKKHCILKDQQSIIRNLGLILFFVGNGIPAGMQINRNYSPMAILIGIVLTVIPIATGWFVCRVILRKSNIDIASIIAGGMTSTPAISILSAKSTVSYDKYSFAYVGALIATIILLN